jgi:hypothetical protein
MVVPSREDANVWGDQDLIPDLGEVNERVRPDPDIGPNPGRGLADRGPIIHLQPIAARGEEALVKQAAHPIAEAEGYARDRL